MKRCDLPLVDVVCPTRWPRWRQWFSRAYGLEIGEELFTARQEKNFKKSTRLCGNSTRPCEIPISRYTWNSRYTRIQISTRPCGCPILGLFKSDFRIFKETSFGTFSGPFGGLRLRFQRGSWRLLEAVFGIDIDFPWEDDSSRPSPLNSRGFYSCCFLLFHILLWLCIAPWKAKPLVGMQTTCEP